MEKDIGLSTIKNIIINMNTNKEKFKNKILKLKNTNIKILKGNGIVDVIRFYDQDNYLILDQSQYNLAILKFI